VPYEAGELKVVALDKNNKPVKEAIVKTAGKPAHIVLTADRTAICNSEKELAFVTATVVDEYGVVCPRANNKITFSAEGPGNLKAADNGDPTSLERFVDPERSAFNGKCVAIVQSTAGKGKLKLVAQSPGLGETKIAIKINK